MQCINCNSHNLKKLGMRFNGVNKGLGYTCNDCNETFVIPKDDTQESETYSTNDDVHFLRDDEYIAKIQSSKRIVFTTALNNSDIDEVFFNSLLQYVKMNKAELVIFPVKYKNPSMINPEEVFSCEYDSRIVPYLVENNFDLGDNVRVLGGLKIQATTENPLSGVDGLSKGCSVILGHPQVSLKTLPRNSEKYPAIVTTTGAITKEHYSTTKAGYKATFNHSMSACVIEFDKDKDFFIRHLNFDGEGFQDLEFYYSPSGRYKNSEIEAIVTGDEHAIFHDPDVKSATYTNKNSIVKTLNPSYIVRHDVLDFFSASHHGRNNVFLKYAKHHSTRMGSVAQELNNTIDFINETTPENTTNIIIAANHNEHLMRWLNECDPKNDPENSLLYHYLMYNMLKNTKIENSSFHCPEPFELYSKEYLGDNSIFLSRNESFNILGVEVSNHGDRGINGSRGSSKQFSNIPVKTITGHTHSPMIDKGNYTVGTSSLMKLSYNYGLSSWDHAHCIIYKNGKRQLLFIRNGKWRSN
jgi:hypothetical protein